MTLQPRRLLCLLILNSHRNVLLIDAINDTVSTTQFYQPDFQLKIVEHTQIDRTATEVLQPPLPAGISPGEREDALLKIKQRVPASELPPILAAKDQASLTEALTSLSFQLR